MTHELGHVLGLPDLDHFEHPQDVMAGQLRAGVSRVSGGNDLRALPPGASPRFVSSVDGLFANDGFDVLGSERSAESVGDRIDRWRRFEVAHSAPEILRQDLDPTRVEWIGDDRTALAIGEADEADIVDQLFAELFNEEA
jgi:hypothetical protein